MPLSKPPPTASTPTPRHPWNWQPDPGPPPTPRTPIIDSDTAKPESEPADERWVFGGSRIGTKKQRLHAWIDEHGEELLFKAVGSYTVGSYTVGSIYDVQVTRTDQERLVRHGQPKYAGGRADTELHEKVAARHRAAEAELGLLARERAAKKDDPVELAIEHFVTLSRKVPASQRTAFLAYVMARLCRTWLT